VSRYMCEACDHPMSDDDSHTCWLCGVKVHDACEDGKFDANGEWEHFVCQEAAYFAERKEMLGR